MTSGYHLDANFTVQQNDNSGLWGVGDNEHEVPCGSLQIVSSHTDTLIVTVICCINSPECSQPDSTGPKVTFRYTQMFSALMKPAP